MPPSDVSFHDLKSALARHGVTCRPTTHGHWKARKGLFGYTFPTISGRSVKLLYVSKLRRKFRLDAENGVDDAKFWGR